MSAPREARAALRAALEVAAREAAHLRGTRERLLPGPVDAAWVRRLEADPVLAERVDGFVARFGRLQDTLGNRVVPRLLAALAEPVGAQIDNLHRLERLGLLRSAREWIEARNLRNRLVHEYVTDPEEFAQALERARELTDLLLDTCERLAARAAALGHEGG